MIDVTVLLGKALICFAGQCHPIIAGPDTPTGQYQLIQRFTRADGYGGDVLQFHETSKDIFAVHRVWTLDKKVDRKSALLSTDPNYRRSLSRGCVNVDEKVYQELVDCKSCKTILIVE